MKQYYKCTIKVSFEDKKGNEKFKKESYIVSAITPTDVEVKMAKYLKAIDHEIIGINTTNIVDIIED